MRERSPQYGTACRHWVAASPVLSPSLITRSIAAVRSYGGR